MIGFTLLFISMFFSLCGIIATCMKKPYNMVFAAPAIVFFTLGIILAGVV